MSIPDLARRRNRGHTWALRDGISRFLDKLGMSLLFHTPEIMLSGQLSHDRSTKNPSTGTEVQAMG